MLYHNRENFVKLFALLLLPLLLFINTLLLNNSKGPYWLAPNIDPDYPYLLNSLCIAESKQVALTEHPGTPVQMLGAIILKIAHFLDISSKYDLPTAVLRNPEFYLRTINAVMIAINVLLLIIIGIIAFILTENIGLSMLLQFSPFFSTTIVTSLTRVSPEPLLLFAGLLFILLIVRISTSDSPNYTFYVISFAVISGFGIATKVTFIPLVIIPLIILPTLQKKIGFLAVTGVSFIIFTLPIIPKYRYLLWWMYNLFIHVGIYGEGEAKIIDGKLYLRSLQQLFLGNSLFFLILFFTIGVLLMGMFSEKLRQNESIWENKPFRLLFAVMTSQLFGIFMVAKHSFDHYLLPVLSLSGVTLFLIFMFLKRKNYFKVFNMKRLTIFIGIFFVLSSYVRIIDIKNVYVDSTEQKNESIEVYKKSENDYKNYIKIYYYRSSSPQYALFFANNWSGSQYSETLKKMYGEAYFYNRWRNTFHTWTHEFLIEKIISKGYGSYILFQGSPIFRECDNTLVTARFGSTLKLEDLLDGKGETIYKIGSFTIPQQFFPIK